MLEKFHLETVTCAECQSSLFNGKSYFDVVRLENSRLQFWYGSNIAKYIWSFLDVKLILIRQKHFSVYEKPYLLSLLLRAQQKSVDVLENLG